MNIERMFPSGGWLVSDIINGQYVKRRYFGYTKKQAIEDFKQEIKALEEDQWFDEAGIPIEDRGRMVPGADE